MYHKYTSSKGSEFSLDQENVELLEERKPFFKWNNITVETKSTSIERILLGDRKSKSYFVVNRRKILNNVFGYAFQNSLTAIIGGSGCGKTTLLNVLIGNSIHGLKVKGSVTVNDKSVDMNLVSSYVYQFDIFYSRLTVYEHLKFQCLLRMGNSLTKKEYEQKIEILLNDFNLIKIKNSHIGHHSLKTTGISGGERKRLSIITELLSDPIILFLDEPTSGLDVYNAGKLIELLHNVSRNGVAVICTIHQPTSQMVPYFDMLGIIADGTSVYFGPTSKAVDFFKDEGYPCDDTINPFDHFLSIVGKDTTDTDNSDEIIKKLAKSNEQNNLFPINSIDSFTPGFLLSLYSFFAGHNDIKKNLNKFSILLQRDFKLMYRDYYLFLFRVLSTSVVAIVFSVIYIDHPLNTFQILETAITYYVDVANMSISMIIGVLYTFPSVLQIYKREHRIGMYNTHTFLLSKYLIEIPQIIIITLIYTLLFNYILLYYYDHTAKAFGLHWSVNFVVSLLSVGIGFLISEISNNSTTAISVGGPLVFLFLVIGVFAIKIESIPYYLKWFKQISWIYYGSEAMTIVGFNNRVLDCNTLLCRPGQVLETKKAINFLGFNIERLNLDFGILVGYTIIVLILCYGYLVIRSFITEKLA